MKNYKRMFIIGIGVFLLGIYCIQAEDLSRAFEFRYVSSNPAANGETDFKGEAEIFNTEQRVDFLKHYAIYAKHFWDDPDLDTEVVTDQEIQAALDNLKPQPLPEIRKEIRLQNWK